MNAIAVALAIIAMVIAEPCANAGFILLPIALAAIAVVCAVHAVNELK
jgi:hypothetical protein